MRWGMFTIYGAPSTTSHWDILNMSNLDYFILSIFHNLGTPLSYRTLIFDLMMSLYIYNAYIYTYIFYLTVKVTNIDIRMDENRRSHKGSESYPEKIGLVLRRGQSFKVTLSLKRKYRADHDRVRVLLSTGSRFYCR